jgi:Fe-S-cluster containining protein
MLKDAEKRGNEIFQKLRGTNINTLAELVQTVPGTSRKIYYMGVVLETLDFATSGIVPCKAGCSSCCHMATNVTLREAQDIAKASGRALTIPTATMTDDEAIAAFEGTPCPFLVDNKCSVYASRPFSCRAHYSVDRDNLLCKVVPGSSILAPTFNNQQFALLNALTYERADLLQYADIREYFPPEITP